MLIAFLACSRTIDCILQNRMTGTGAWNVHKFNMKTILVSCDIDTLLHFSRGNSFSQLQTYIDNI